VQSLAYKEQTPEDAEFVRLVYTSRLRKYKHAKEHALTRRRLVEEFGLSDNPDVLFSFADALYAQFRWSDCYAITSRYELFKWLDRADNAHALEQNTGLGSGAYTNNAPTHCVYAPPVTFTLEALHTRARARRPRTRICDKLVCRWSVVPHSEEVVRCAHVLQVRFVPIHRSRNSFISSKTSLMDPRLGPAWIAFAHTFAFEGEHDHAVTAYSTCARMFTGYCSPLPSVFPR
jgi:anaphase-promoting complex subunit 6